MTPRQRITAFWKDYDRFDMWPLSCTMILHFGRNTALLLPEASSIRNVNLGYDPCLPQEDHPDYGFFELFVDAAERAIEAEMAKAGDGKWDRRLVRPDGYPAGRRADTHTLNLRWSRPLEIIDNAEEMKPTLIAFLKTETLREGVGPLTAPTQRSLQLHS